MKSHLPVETANENFKGVAHVELYYKAVHFYLQEHPDLINGMLNVLALRVDHTRVVDITRKAGHLRLTWLLFQSNNVSAVNEIGLAQKIEKHELLEMRQVAAYIYKKAGRWKQSITLSKKDNLYKKTFGTEEKRGRFLRWSFQSMKKGIQKLDLRLGGVTSLLQINDLKNSPGPSREELRLAPFFFFSWPSRLATTAKYRSHSQQRWHHFHSITLHTWPSCSPNKTATSSTVEPHQLWSLHILVDSLYTRLSWSARHHFLEPCAPGFAAEKSIKKSSRET